MAGRVAGTCMPHTPSVRGIYLLPLLLAAALIVGAAAGWFAAERGWIGNPARGIETEADDLPPLREHTEYPYINPLLFCFTSENKEFTEFKPLERKIEQVVKQSVTAGRADRVAVYYRELDSGHWVGVNETERFSPASMFKVPILITYYRLARNHPETLSRRITYDGRNPTRQWGITETETLQAGQSYTVAALLEKMIIHSDNKSANLLFAHTDQNSLAEVFSDLGIPQPDGSDIGDIISAKTYGLFFRVLYNATYLGRRYSERALELLAKTTFSDGLVAGVPSSTAVAHKFGDRLTTNGTGNATWQLHDCGVIYYPGGPYLLCVMTEGRTPQQLASTIKDISTIVYRETATFSH